MASSSRDPENSLLDTRLLSDPISHDNNEDNDEVILLRASFKEMEENFVNYQTALWVLSSLPLILACGIGLFMLLYLPVRRWIVRRDFQSRKLYATANSIVYKVTKPAFFPFLGVLKKEKHVLLPSLADVVVEQGYLQSYFGIYSIRFENLGVQRPASDDVHIQGVVHPKAFKKAIMVLISRIRNESFAKQVSVNDDLPNYGVGFFHSPRSSLLRTRLTSQQMAPSASMLHEPVQPSAEQLLHKLEEVGNTLKKVHSLVEERL